MTTGEGGGEEVGTRATRDDRTSKGVRGAPERYPHVTGAAQQLGREPLAPTLNADLELRQATILQEQAALTTSLLSLVTPPAATSAPAVKPGRPARALIARILIVLLQRGESKGLFDVAQALLRGVSGSEAKGAPEREKEWRIASAFVLGELYAALGSHVRSFNCS